MPLNPTSYYRTPERKLGNMDGNDLSTNEEGVAIGFGHGSNPFAVMWVDDAYRQRGDPVTSEVKKGKDVITGYNIYCDVIGILALGSARYVRQIKKDQEVVWEGTAKFNYPNPTEKYINVPGVGEFYISPGTMDQAEDTHLVPYIEALENRHQIPGFALPYPDPDDLPPEAAPYSPSAQTAGKVHPAYRGFIRVVILNLFCGFERTNVPSIEIVVDCLPEIHTAEVANRLSNEGCNPVFHIAKAFEDPLAGAGDDSVLDADSFKTVAPLIQRNASISIPGVGLHYAYWGHQAPKLTAPVDLITHANNVCAYFDGFLKLKDGKIHLDYFPQHAAEPEGLPVLDASSLAGPPNPSPARQKDQKNEVKVSHRDRGLLWKTIPSTARNRAHIRRTGRVNELTINGENLITKHQGSELAARSLKNQINFQCEAPVFSSWIRSNAVELGSLIRLEWSPLSLSMVCRVVGWRRAAKGRVDTLSLVQEPGLKAARLPDEPHARPDLTPQPPEEISQYHIFQPAKAWTGPSPTLLFLAAREADNVIAMAINYSADDAVYELLGRQTAFALPVTLDADIDSDDTSLSVTPAGIDSAILIAQTAAAQSDDTLLLVFGSEVMSIGAAAAGAGSSKAVEVLRGRKGSTAADHSTGATGWVAFRSELKFIAHPDFPKDGSNRFFKLQPRTHYSELELDDIVAIDHAFDDRQVLTPTDVKVEGVIGAWSITMGILEADTIACEVYVSDDPNVFPSAPDFEQPINLRQPGKIRFLYSYEGAGIEGQSRYFQFRLIDSSGNFSEFTGVYSSNSYGLPEQGPVVELSAAYWFLYTSQTAARFRMQARVGNYSGKVSYQWFRWPINETEGEPILISGQNENHLDPEKTDILPSGIGPNFRKYRVVVNGSQYDETTLWVYGGQNYASGVTPYYAYMTNELVTIDVDESFNVLPGQITSFSRSTMCAVDVVHPGYAMHAIDPPGDAGNHVKFHLVLPAGLSAYNTRPNWIYLSSAGALEAGLADTVFPIEVWAYGSKIADLEYTVRKNVKTVDVPYMELVADGDLTYSQPISPTTVTFTAEARKGQYDILASAEIAFDIDANGVITQAGAPTGDAEIVFEIQQDADDFMTLRARHTTTRASDSISLSSELSDPVVIPPLTAGAGRSLDLILVYGETADLTDGEGRSIDPE